MPALVLDASVTLAWALAGEVGVEDARALVHRVADEATFARRQGLTLYDAGYLELAARRSLALATFDGQLARAAAAEQVPLAMGTVP